MSESVAGHESVGPEIDMRELGRLPPELQQQIFGKLKMADQAAVARAGKSVLENAMAVQRRENPVSQMSAHRLCRILELQGGDPELRRDVAAELEGRLQGITNITDSGDLKSNAAFAKVRHQLNKHKTSNQSLWLMRISRFFRLNDYRHLIKASRSLGRAERGKLTNPAILRILAADAHQRTDFANVSARVFWAAAIDAEKLLPSEQWVVASDRLRQRDARWVKAEMSRYPSIHLGTALIQNAGVKVLKHLVNPENANHFQKKAFLKSNLIKSTSGSMLDIAIATGDIPSYNLLVQNGAQSTRKEFWRACITHKPKIALWCHLWKKHFPQLPQDRTTVSAVAEALRGVKYSEYSRMTGKELIPKQVFVDRVMGGDVQWMRKAQGLWKNQVWVQELVNHALDKGDSAMVALLCGDRR